jgi:hypothetical protein
MSLQHLFRQTITLKMNVYQPSNYGVFTYVVPRIPASMTEDDIAGILNGFWRSTMKGVPTIQRIDLIEVKDNADLQQAFVYHQACSHAAALNDMLKTAEKSRKALRAHYGGGRRRPYLLLLPNKTPMTAASKEMADQIADIAEAVVDNCFQLTAAGINTIPFDTSALTDERFDTASISPEEMDRKFAAKLKQAKKMLIDSRRFCNKNGVSADDDNEKIDEMMEEEAEIYRGLEENEREIAWMQWQAMQYAQQQMAQMQAEWQSFGLPDHLMNPVV